MAVQQWQRNDAGIEQGAQVTGAGASAAERQLEFMAAVTGRLRSISP